VYGGPHASPIRENDFVGIDPTQPGSEYAVAKLATESLAAGHGRDTGLDVRIARLFTGIGAGYRSHGHLAHVSLVDDACAGRAIRLRTGGRAVRSYLYGADLAVWLLAMLSRGSPLAMNVGADRPVTVLEFARMVAEASGRSAADVVVGQEPEAAPERSYSVPSVVLARQALGVDAWTSVECAIKRMITPRRRT
jgi:dTDP-glucose 4,6-dehydratase